MKDRSRTFGSFLVGLAYALIILPNACLGADWSQGVHDRLEILGFEGIRTVVTPEVAAVAYENRIFRYEIEALGLAAEAGVQNLPAATILVLIPTNRGVPIIEVSAVAGDWSAFLSGQLSTGEFRSRVRIGSPRTRAGEGPEAPGLSGSGSSSLKFDVGVRPLAELRLGIADNPFEYGLWMAPEVTMSPFQGTLLTGQMIVELHDEFDPFARKVAPGRTTLSVWSRLPGSITGVVSGGYFPGNRYGLTWEAGRFLVDGRVELRLAGDYSGFLKFSTGNRVLYSDMKAWSGLGSVIVRPPTIDLEVNVTAGKFIHGDRGARMDVLRRFRETDFGFFVIKTNEGTVGGFRFNVPLPVKRQLRPARLRPVTVPAFPFEYREDQEPTGRRVRMFDSLDRVRKGLTPVFILNNLRDLRPAAGKRASP